MTRASHHSLPDVIASSDEDRASITETSGTVARFTMAYNLERKGRFAFGPPLWQRAPSLVYLMFALGVVALVASAYAAPSNSRLHVWIVGGDEGRPLGSVPLAFLIALSAVGTVVRAALRGVVVTSEGLEARYLLPFGLPKIRRWSWAQIDRFVIDERDVLLELWDGTYERLPRVRDGKGLGELLESIAAARGRPVTRLD